jgi:hypothetical protein
MAPQQELGILSERRSGISPLDHCYSPGSRPDLNAKRGHDVAS